MILEVKDISKSFAIERGMFKSYSGKLKALNGVGFSLSEFDTLGLVGESGSGKTTLAKIILGLISADSGQVIFNPEIISNFHKDVAIIFQNPYNSLNPKMKVVDIISEPLWIHRIVKRKKIKEEVIRLLELVSLTKDMLTRYPKEFSGGQRQRIAIARALASQPKLLILDEPISSLDLTIQAQMLNLFNELKAKLSLTYIFISHNLTVVKHIADHVIVMKDGAIVENASVSEIFEHPAHPYTQALLSVAKG
jgi:ABC-type oligopeptide transport system ATPase subunit